MNECNRNGLTDVENKLMFTSVQREAERSDTSQTTKRYRKLCIK